MERSTDGANWSLIEQTTGAGNSSQEIRYETEDRNPFKGINYYRLKQFDFNGEFSFSEIRTVNYSLNFKDEIIVYPNPAVNEVFIIGSPKNIENIKLYNTLGQQMAPSIRVIGHQARIDLSEFESGFYIIKTPSSLSKILKQ